MPIIRKPLTKIKKYYQTKKGKVIIISSLGLLMFIFIGLTTLLLLSSGETFTDSNGTIWHKFKNPDKQLFKVYIEQASFSSGRAYINSDCDPRVELKNTTRLNIDTSKYKNGIDRPNHCRIIAGHYKALSSAGDPVNTYVLLPDGSLLTLDGGSVSSIQVNINDSETRIVQDSGNVFYRIAKQRAGKKFIIQAGRQEFAALGTKVFTNIDEDTVKLGLFEGAGTLTEFTRGSEAVQIQVGTFAQYLYKSVEQIKIDQILKMSTLNLLNSNGFFARQIENDDLNGLSSMAKLDFAGMQAIMPEVVNLEEDYISNKLQTEIEKSTRKAQEIWDNMWEDIKVEDAKRAAERKAAHEERMRAQQEFTSQPSGSTSGSSGSSGSAPMHSRCVKKGSQPASYQLCKMSGGNASGSTCCFK